jgi:hypothetical protein
LIKYISYLILLPLLLLSPIVVYAGEPPTTETCYSAGYVAGQNHRFDQEVFEECEPEYKKVDGKNQYEKGFIDGCDSVKGNSEEECKSFIE